MTKPKIYTFLSGVLLFSLFVLYSYLVHKNLFTGLDFDTTVRLQDKISQIFNTPFSLLSLMGSFEIVSFILFILWVITRKLRFIFTLFSFVAIHVFELFGKMFVTHPGPPYLFVRYDIPFSFPSSYVQPGSSYPSGHLARTLFLSVIISFLILRSKRFSSVQKKLLYCSIVIIVVLMFISRIYLGEHWLSDVLGGGLLGASFGFLSLAFF